MTVKVPSVGEDAMLNSLKTDWNNNTTLRLFKNDYTPVDGSTKANFTEADFSGYAGAALANWGVVAQNQDDRAEMVHPEITFAHDGGGTANTCYGWYVTDDLNADEVLFAERFPGGSRTLDGAGDDVKVTVTFTLGEPAA